MARKAQFTFAAFTFPVKLDSAKLPAPDVSNLCPGQPGKDKHDPLPVKAPKVCTTCGPITDHDVLLKGVKTSAGYSVLTQEQIAAAKDSYVQEYKGKLEFVAHPADEFLAQTAPGDSLNYVTPADASGSDHYQLMVKLVTEHPEIAFVALNTPVSATSLFLLAVRNGVLVVEQRTRTQGLKPQPSVGGNVNDLYYQMVNGVLENLVVPYDPSAYEDKYRAAVAEMTETAEIVTAGAATSAPAVSTESDILTKLQALAGGKATKRPARKRATPKEKVA